MSGPTPAEWAEHKSRMDAALRPTLTDFLLARIAEDERDARARLQNGEPQHAPTPWKCPSPARVLAECDAKRRIVEALVDLITADSHMQDLGWDLLGALALPYADHPDYREEWRP